MVELKQTGSGSWFEARCAARLGAKLGERLWERCKGRKGLFITLTYRRDEYQDARDLYRRTGEEQHVPLFLRKIGRHLRESLVGRWFCKLEFQRGGWVHWHIILLDVDHIPHAVVDELWGRGHVWLKRLSKARVKYVCKYVVKPGEFPAWLLMERPRSVKVTRVSRGFWGDGPGSRDDLESGGDLDDDASRAPDPFDEWGPGKPPRVDAYVPIGTRIGVTCESFVARDEGKSYFRGRCDLASLLVLLMARGCDVVGRSTDGWLLIDADLAAVEGAARAAAAAPPPPFHLRGSQDPDGAGVAVPWFVEDWLIQSATEGGAA